MWDIDRDKAKSLGFTDQEIDQYLAGLNEQETQPTAQTNPQQDYSPLLAQPTQAPVAPAPTPPTTEPQTPQPPDVVTPMTNNDFVMTQGRGENPYYYGEGGHKGEDIAYTEPASTYKMTNPIGGVPFSGTGGDFGNYYGVIGANPQELAQMTPEEKVRMSTDARQYMDQSPAGIAELSQFIPGKNINLQGHLAEPVDVNPMGVGTGSATMNMGSTGNSSGVHLHDEFVDTQGNLQSLSDLLKKEIKKRAKK
jgi:murein DD-endopeptidase MepM/ murein hydrolase activator NlpD